MAGRVQRRPPHPQHQPYHEEDARQELCLGRTGGTPCPSPVGRDSPAHARQAPLCCPAQLRERRARRQRPIGGVGKGGALRRRPHQGGCLPPGPGPPGQPRSPGSRTSLSWLVSHVQGPRLHVPLTLHCTHLCSLNLTLSAARSAQRRGECQSPPRDQLAPSTPD